MKTKIYQISKEVVGSAYCKTYDQINLESWGCIVNMTWKKITIHIYGVIHLINNQVDNE